MQQAWIAFDCLIVGALLALGFGAGHRSNFLRWWAPRAKLAVLSDVGLTAWQAATFLVVHPRNLVHATAWLIDLIGPVLASVFLSCFVAQSALR